MAKIRDMGEAFYLMSEDAYRDWVDALPRDEFLEFVLAIVELDDKSKSGR